MRKKHNKMGEIMGTKVTGSRDIPFQLNSKSEWFPTSRLPLTVQKLQ